MADYEPTKHDIDLCRAHAALYRSRGFNPLPSSYKGDIKKPLCMFAEYWEKPFPESEFNKFWTPSMQLMTGRFWRLMVIDLDSPESFDEFNSWGNIPRTWISHSPGGGAHVLFRVEHWFSELKKGFIWKSKERLEVEQKNLTLPEGQKLKVPHQAIERIADRSLIMVPPSIHPKTGGRYEFDAWECPKRVPGPAKAPGWLLEMPLLAPLRKPEEVAVERPVEPRKPRESFDQRRDWQEVVDGIPGKVGLVESWGLKFARGSSAGWMMCHAVGRDDTVASAQFHPGKGIYKDMGDGTTLSLPGLAAALGVYPDSRTAMEDFRSRYER